MGREVSVPDALVSSTTSNSAMLESAWGGACVNQPGWNTDFAHHMYQCGIASAGQQPAAGTCMQHKQHVSRSCGVCLGDLIHCGMQCISECCVGGCPHSGACKRCNALKCNPAFIRCAGVNPARRLEGNDSSNGSAAVGEGVDANASAVREVSVPDALVS